MSSEHGSAHAQASEEATDWLILLQEEPDDRELICRFEAWLAASPVNAEAWEHTNRVGQVIGEVGPAMNDRWQAALDAYRSGRDIAPPAASSKESGRNFLAAISGKRDRGGKMRSFAGAALAAALALVVLPGVILHLRADYVTGTAETRTVALADGTKVVLAPDSAIRVAYGKAERRVDLLSGEAYFDVVHNADRPFRVSANGLQTTDIGTAFDLRRAPEGASVAVRQGSVRVSYRTGVSERLRAGDTVEVGWDGTVVRGHASADAIAAWRRDQLVAEDIPMHEVVDRLRPYYGGKIVLSSSALADSKVTGVYNLQDPIEALRGVAEAHGATVYRITPWILLVARG